MAGKHTLFYSNHCQHSREAVALLTRLNLRERFVLVCVERFAQQLPPFVDCVPLLYTTNREVLTDDDLFLFVQHLRAPEQRQPPQQQPQQPQRELELQPFQLGGGGDAAFSDSYSLLEDADDIAGTHSRGYIYLNDDDGGASADDHRRPAGGDMPAPVETRRIDDFATELNRYKAERELDLGGGTVPRTI